MIHRVGRHLRDAVTVDNRLTSASVGDRPASGHGGPSAFPCPRCSVVVAARFYGPCDDCRAQLRRTLGDEGREVERESFVPAMHVTPNAVALKE